MRDLKDLKNQILDELIAVTDGSGLQPEERFDLILTRYINSGDTKLLESALDAAKGIEDASPKAAALIQLLEEVDIAEVESVGSNQKASQSETRTS